MSPAKPRSVRVQAPGKINASLLVGPRRPDGYHSVASVYLAVSLYEEVLATAVPEPGIRISLESGGGLAVPVDGIPLGPGNLAARAAALVAERAPEAGGVHLAITKRVPVAGGMGGGSADAAAALLACNELWGAGLSPAELAALAATLGADVPFALLGGAAVGLGVGDRLTPLESAAPRHWVLVQSDSGLSTPRVYGTLDELRRRGQIDADEPVAADPALTAALAGGNNGELAAVLRNDLQPAALDLAPELRGVLAAGEELGALAGMVSGSGPTLAFLADGPDAAAGLEAQLRRRGHNALAVSGPAEGARILPGPAAS